MCNATLRALDPDLLSPWQRRCPTLYALSEPGLWTSPSTRDLTGRVSLWVSRPESLALEGSERMTQKKKSEMRLMSSFPSAAVKDKKNRKKTQFNSGVNTQYHSVRSASQLQWCLGSTQLSCRPQAHRWLPGGAPAQCVCTCPPPGPPTHQLRGGPSATHRYTRSSHFPEHLIDLQWELFSTVKPLQGTFLLDKR